MTKKINGIEFEEIDNFVCRECGATAVEYQHIPTNQAIKAKCGKCGLYIKFVKQLNAVPKPATDKQVKYAKTIAKVLKIQEPDFNDIAVTSKWLEKYILEFNKTKK